MKQSEIFKFKKNQLDWKPIPLFGNDEDPLQRIISDQLDQLNEARDEALIIGFHNGYAAGIDDHKDGCEFGKAYKEFTDLAKKCKDKREGKTE